MSDDTPTGPQLVHSWLDEFCPITADSLPFAIGAIAKQDIYVRDTSLSELKAAAAKTGFVVNLNTARGLVKDALAVIKQGIKDDSPQALSTGELKAWARDINLCRDHVAGGWSWLANGVQVNAATNQLVVALLAALVSTFGPGEERREQLTMFLDGVWEPVIITGSVMDPHLDHWHDGLGNRNAWAAYSLPTDRSHDVDPWTQTGNPLIALLTTIVSDKAQREYLLRWMLYKVLHPTTCMGTAIVLSSEEQGTGKTSIAALMSTIFGENGVDIASLRDITGQFSAIEDGHVFIHASEITFGGDKKGAEILKAVITDSRLVDTKYVAKRKRVKNMLGVMMTTNSDHALHTEAFDRRYAFVEVNAVAKGWGGWDEWHSWRRRSGTEDTIALAVSAVGMDKWSPTIVEGLPSATSVVNWLKSANSPTKWMMECIQRGRLLDGMRPGEGMPLPTYRNGHFITSDVYEAYTGWCERQGRIKVSYTDVFWKELLSTGVIEARVRLGKRDGIIDDTRPWAYKVLSPQNALAALYASRGIVVPDTFEVASKWANTSEVSKSGGKKMPREMF